MRKKDWLVYSRYFSIIILFTCASWPNVAAQPLSLADALQSALQNNYEIKISRLQQDIAQRNNSMGAAGFYPSLSLTGTQGNNYTDPDNPATFLNFPYRNITFDAAIEMNWVLFNGFRVWLTRSKLSLLEEQSAGNTAVVIENTIQAVLLAYYRAQVEREKLQVQREVCKLSKARYDLALLKKELGAAGTFEELQFKTAYFADSSDLLLQELVLQSALTELKLLMAAPDTADFSLSDTLDRHAPELDYQSLREAMRAGNNTLKNQYVNYEIFKKDVALQKALLYPTAAASLGARQSFNNFKNIEGISTERFPSSTGSTRNYYANFSLTFNLFNGGNILRAIRNTKVQAEIASINISDAAHVLDNRLRLHYDRYAAQRTLVLVSETNVQAARINLHLAEDRLKNGTITSLDYRALQTQYLSASIRLLEAVYSLKETETELLRLSGGIINAY